jgi:hypothetical protein
MERYQLEPPIQRIRHAGFAIEEGRAGAVDDRDIGSGRRVMFRGAADQAGD